MALVLITVITGCQNSNVNNDGDNSGKTGETIPEGGKLFNEPVTFSLMILEHPTFPYTEGLFLETAIAEKYNVNFDVTPVQDITYTCLRQGIKYISITEEWVKNV